MGGIDRMDWRTRVVMTAPRPLWSWLSAFSSSGEATTFIWILLITTQTQLQYSMSRY